MKQGGSCLRRAPHTPYGVRYGGSRRRDLEGPALSAVARGHRVRDGPLLSLRLRRRTDHLNSASRGVQLIGESFGALRW